MLYMQNYNNKLQRINNKASPDANAAAEANCVATHQDLFHQFSLLSLKSQTENLLHAITSSSYKLHLLKACSRAHLPKKTHTRAHTK